MRGLNDFKREGVLLISLFVFTIFLLLPYPSFSEEKVQYLKKVGEIKDGFSSERENFFIKITGLCCDDEGNLYVADSGWNKIFKFDSNGKFLMSFGREGQGPGEFMAGKLMNQLRISFGNDKRIYVNDPGNQRISIFSKNGTLIRTVKTPHRAIDSPVVNSKGDIYLISPSGIKVIDCYDSNFKLKASILDLDSYFEFPFGKPPDLPGGLVRKPTYLDTLKLITKNDELIIVSNYSFKVFVFDKNNNKIKEFKITEKRFIEDYERVIKKVIKEGAFLNPFEAFIDKNDNICLAYFNERDKVSEVYVYSTTGKYLGRLLFPEKIISFWISGNKKFDFIYALKNHSTTVAIFKH